MVELVSSCSWRGGLRWRFAEEFPSRTTTSINQHNALYRGLAFGAPAVELENWHDAFAQLAALTRSGRVLILLDEISWMASRDPAGVIGLQFENLVLNNLPSVLERLDMDLSGIVSASPYIQNATRRNKAGCQIDLLIHARFDTLYVCEVKFSRHIDAGVIDEVRQKIDRLKKPRNFSVRPILIYEGEIAESVKNSMFFDKLLHFGELLNE